MKTMERTLTAYDFLEKYLELKSFVPDWNSVQLNSNEPRMYRLNQLNAFMAAFELGTDLQKDFESAKFLENRNEQNFEPILMGLKSIS